MIETNENGNCQLKCEKNSSTADLPSSVTASNVKLTEAGCGKENNVHVKSADDAYDPFSNRDPTHRTSDFGALVHLFKSSFGSGILAVPGAFKNSGLLFGLFGTIIIGMLCSHCVAVLVKCSHVLSVKDKKPSLGFEETAEAAFRTGPNGVQKYSQLAKRLVTLLLFATYYLGNTVYVVLISNALKKIIDNQFEVDLNIRLYILITAIPLVPLGIGRRLKYLVPISAFGAIFIIFGLAVTFYYSLTDLPPVSSRSYMKSLDQIPSFFATIVFAMEGIGTVLPIENSMKHPNHFRGYCGVLSIAMTLIVGTYSLVGFTCYLKYGELTDPNITLNLPHDALSETVKVMVALSILFTYGLQFCVPSEIMWKRIAPHVSSMYENTAYYIMRAVMILGTVIIALIIPDLGPFISLVGALCLATLGLFLPAVIETVTYWEKDTHPWRVIKNVLIIAISIMTTVSGTYSSVQEIINHYNL